MEVSKNRENTIIFLTKCLLVVLGLFTTIPYINDVGRDIYKLCCAWCFLCVAYLFIKRTKTFLKLEYVLLFLFCCSYAITILVSGTEHLINEVAILGYTGMLFFAMNYCDTDRDEKEIKKELSILSWIVIIITFVFSLIGFLMFLFSVSVEISHGETTFVYGMRENRLWGLYNPNSGSVLNYVSILLTVLLPKKKLGVKIFLGMNIIIQSLCFILTQSRGGWICLLTYIAIYFFFIKKYNFKETKQALKWCYKAVVTAALCIVVIAGGNLLKTGLGYIPVAIEEAMPDAESHLLEKDKFLHGKGEKPSTSLERLDKKENNLESISTGRSDLWKMGLKAYTKSPVFGIGYRSIDDVLVEEMSKGAYINSGGGGLHNIYITVLVSCGAVGFILFALYLLCVLKKVAFGIFNPNISTYGKCIMAFIPVWLVGELVESRIVLGMNFQAIIFWIMIGYVGYYTKERK